MKDLWALRLPLFYEQLGAGLGPEDATSGSQGEEGPKATSSQLLEEEEANAGASGETMRKARATLTMVYSLSLCYMGAMMLRVPLSVGDLHRLVCKPPSSLSGSDRQ